MSGHSKWATIKRKKEKTDSQKAKVFTKITREIIVATKAGGSDPEGNFQLRLAIQKAKESNMPNDNIQRAIKRGAGGNDGNAFEEVTYEGYGPAGVAILINVLTDNRNRTASEMRYIFSRNGGNLGEAGCVGWMFDAKGMVSIPREEVTISEEEALTIAMEAGAEDMRSDTDLFELVTAPGDLDAVRRHVESRSLPIDKAEIIMVPQNTMQVTGEAVKEVLKLVEVLEEHDDVQEVYSNFDISDEDMDKYTQ